MITFAHMISISNASVREINALNLKLFFLQDYLKKKTSTLFKFKRKKAAYLIIIKREDKNLTKIICA